MYSIFILQQMRLRVKQKSLFSLASAEKVCYNGGISQGGGLLPLKIQIKQNEKERENEALRTCLL
jgi:hypothetical protein